MPESRRYPFDELPTADLVVDALYEGGTKGNTSDDPLGKLLPCGNQGGFRFRNRRVGSGKQFVVLYSDLSDNDWPDVLDVELGRFTYYGDNKRPGHALHETRRGGNAILNEAFEHIHDEVPRPSRSPALPDLHQGPERARRRVSRTRCARSARAISVGRPRGDMADQTADSDSRTIARPSRCSMCLS